MSWDVGAWVLNTLKTFLNTYVITNHGTQTFRDNGTFTVPPGIYKIYITAAGGGGGGGGAYSSFAGGGGGGGACILKQAFNVTPGQQIPITIGAGGAGGVSNSSVSKVTSGGNGGATVIGSLITLEGGKGAKDYATDRVIIGSYGGHAGPGGGGGGVGGKQASTSDGYYLPGGVGYMDGENWQFMLGAIASSGQAFSGKGGGSAAGGPGGNIGHPPSLEYVLQYASMSGAGGGGSVGKGGDGGYAYSSSMKANPTAGVDGGGGGGGAYYSSTLLNGAAGGKGIAIIEW